MEITVFYAWQSDRDKKVNRYFIQEAAEKALKRITDDASIDFSLKLDHDTKDVPGMPEITTTILKKIEESHIFLADLTFVAVRKAEEPGGKSKYVPNPNVLFELGYAFKSLGSERIICVMNTAYGDAELQIFDLAHRRWPIRYELTPEDQANKADIRKSLSAEIESAVRSILKSGTITNRNETSQEQLRAKRMAGWIHDGRQRWSELVKKDLAGEKPSRYAHGIWLAAYSLIGKFDPPEIEDLPTLLRKIENDRIGLSGWAVWSVSDCHRYEEVLECWIGKGANLDVAHSHFWWVSPEGSLFLLRGYQEDCEADKVAPGTVLWVETPIWDIGEILLHSQRLARELGDESASVALRFMWEGLTDRNLSSRIYPRLEKTLNQTKKVCHQPSVSSQFTVSVKDISTNLPEIIGTITKPLYQCFDLYKPSADLIRQEISKLTKDSL